MYLLANTGNSLSLLVFTRSISVILIDHYWYRVSFDTELPVVPEYVDTNTRLRFLPTNPIDAGLGLIPLRIGVAISDFEQYKEADDVYPKPKNHI